MVTALRSLLRFLHVEGIIDQPLTDAVPPIASWKLAGLPKTLHADQVVAFLASCDRSTTVGRRDLAILIMVVRQGLRAGEVAALRLDDIDWRHGEITLRGKGNRYERQPRCRPMSGSRCRRTLPVLARWPIGPVCNSCYTAILRAPAECARCATFQPLIGRGDQGAGICGPCAGFDVDYTCHRCGRTGNPYGYGRCAHCVLTERQWRARRSSRPNGANGARQTRQLARSTATVFLRRRLAARV
jgi:integrase